MPWLLLFDVDIKRAFGYVKEFRSEPLHNLFILQIKGLERIVEHLKQHLLELVVALHDDLLLRLLRLRVRNLPQVLTEEYLMPSISTVVIIIP